MSGYEGKMYRFVVNSQDKKSKSYIRGCEYEGCEYETFWTEATCRLIVMQTRAEKGVSLK